MVARDARPGVRLPAQAFGVRVRVTLEGDAASEPVGVSWGLEPAGVARLSAPGALPGREVADLAADAHGVWGTLLEGGLVRVCDDRLEVEAWGRAEGLPADHALSVAVDGDTVWVGTTAGLARVREGRVDRVWDRSDGLPDDWVQAVGPRAPEGAWAGTFRGLARVDDAEVRRVLGPWSVFSVVDGADGRAWAGYQGLQGLPAAEPIEGVSADLNVWDVDLAPPWTLLATDSAGVMVLHEGLLAPFHQPPGGAAYALHRLGGRLYAATGEDGLVRLTASGHVERRWGVAEGLPSDVAFEVVGGPPGRLWVGTDDGLALLGPDDDRVVAFPRAPAAAGVPAHDVVGGRRWALLATDEGVVALGRPPRAWRGAAAVAGPVRALVVDGRELWVVAERSVVRFGRRGPTRWGLPVSAHAAAVVDGVLWLGGPSGLHALDTATGHLVPGPIRGPVTTLSVDGQGALWLGAPRGVSVVGQLGARTFEQARASVAIAPADGVTWSATRRGVERLDPATGEAALVAGLDQRVVGLAAGPDGEVLAWLEGGVVVRVPSGLPVTGLPPLPAPGGDGRLEIDAAGRIWLLGEAGAAVLWQ